VVRYCRSGKSARTGRDAKHAQFSFDEVFGPDASQEDVFAEIRPLVQSCMDGFNICILAYGQVWTCAVTVAPHGQPHCLQLAC
jgi:Microtubule binding